MQHHKCKVENSSTNIEEDEKKRIASWSHLDTFQGILKLEKKIKVEPEEIILEGIVSHHILKGEIIKEEHAEIEPFSEYGVEAESHLEKDSRARQNTALEEDEIDVNRKNDTRKDIDSIHSKKKHHCKNCSDFFANKSEKEVYERTHPVVLPFQCNYCSKNFALKSNLRKHEGTHIREKEFQCDFCSKYFARRSHLSIHERTHSGEKPFQCKICLKLFAHMSSAVRHGTRIHLGENNSIVKFGKKC